MPWEEFCALSYKGFKKSGHTVIHMCCKVLVCLYHVLNVIFVYRLVRLISRLAKCFHQWLLNCKAVYIMNKEPNHS